MSTASRRKKGDVEEADSPASVGREHDPAKDLAAAQFAKDLVSFGKRTGGDLAANLACLRHRQDLAKILTSANGGCLDADFSRSHHDR